MTEEKFKSLSYFIVHLLKPSIREFIYYQNPEVLSEWQFNCCRQISIMTNYFLREILLNNDSGYIDVQSWVGEFTDLLEMSVVPKPIRYDHSWVYCINKDPSLNLMIDTARNHKPFIFKYSEKNEYSRLDKGYENMRLIKKEMMNYDECIMMKESMMTYTAPEVAKRLIKYMNNQSIFMDKRLSQAA